MFKFLLTAIIGYLLGSISTGILVSRMEGRDIRAEGSHNTGASNALRVLGVKGGALTFLGDFAKAALAVLIGRWIAGEYGGLVGGIAVVLGHNWPLFFGFQGGKGVACSVAVLLLTCPWQGAAAIAACVIVIAVTKYISLGSMTMLAVFFLLVLFTKPFWPYAVWAFVMLALCVYRHRSNIERLKNGTENKIGHRV